MGGGDSSTERTIYPAAKTCTAGGHSGRSCRWLLGEKPLSILEIGGDFLLHLRQRDDAPEELAVDEEGRGRMHIEILRGGLPQLLDSLQHLLIFSQLV